jgi:hypothetical protein
VAAERGEHDARRAVGCLVEPREGDCVLVVLHESGCHVLCVLDREAEGPNVLAVDGDLAIEARGGTIEVTAAHDVKLFAQGRAEVAAGEISVAAAEACARVDRLTLIAQAAQAHVTKLSVVAREVHGVVERLTQRLKRSWRVVEETESVRAATLDYRASALLNARGGTALLTAERLVKLDGEQVHLG